MSKEDNDLAPLLLLVFFLVVNNLSIFPGNSYDIARFDELRAESVAVFDKEFEEYEAENEEFYPDNDEEPQTQTQVPVVTPKKSNSQSTDIGTTEEVVVQETVTDERKDRLVLFTGYDESLGIRWCGPCISFDNRILNPLKNANGWVLNETNKAHIQIIAVDSNGYAPLDKENLKEKYNITSFPTLVQLRDGKEVARYNDSETSPNKLYTITVWDIPKLITGEK